MYWIAVDPLTQSKGVGTGLIQYVKQYIREKKGKLIILETSGRAGYEKERRFYEKNGYQAVVNIPDFYKKDDSLVIFVKYLNLL